MEIEKMIKLIKNVKLYIISAQEVMKEYTLSWVSIDHSFENPDWKEK